MPETCLQLQWAHGCARPCLRREPPAPSSNLRQAVRLLGQNHFVDDVNDTVRGFDVCSRNRGVVDMHVAHRLYAHFLTLHGRNLH